MDGHFFFDNRFTLDAQPGLTVHLYFFVLGLFARVLGIPFAMNLARAALSFAFVQLLATLVLQLDGDVFVSKLAMVLACIGGGLGFLSWQNFGQAIANPAAWQQWLLLGRLPTDVWQPESFGFPSMLTNGLFMASLCLIVAVLLCVLRAKDSWRNVLTGAIALGLLMNIHSYDVLLIVLVLGGFLAMMLAQKQASWGWTGRVFLIGLGAAPAALWFLHVLRVDPVFQSRAATETFSPNFRQIMVGVLPSLLLSLTAIFGHDGISRRRTVGVAMLGALLAGLFVLAPGHLGGYWASFPIWWFGYAVCLAILAVVACGSVAWNLVVAWAIIGLCAPYFPALFQRKLLMGLGIPLGILAAYGLAEIMNKLERSPRNLVAALGILLLSASSLRWFQRELLLIRNDVSNTTVHPVYLTKDVGAILSYFNQNPRPHRIVLAMPGVPQPTDDPDIYETPYIPDLNPIVTGLTGSYTYAGHWSETPQYSARRNSLTNLFMIGSTDKAAFLESTKADFIIAPQPEAFPKLRLDALKRFGVVVYEGSQFALIRLR